MVHCSTVMTRSFPILIPAARISQALQWVPISWDSSSLLIMFCVFTPQLHGGEVPITLLSYDNLPRYSYEYL